MNNIPAPILEKVAHYLEGSMDASEKAAFEANLLQDPALQSLVDAHKQLNEVLVDYQTTEFKKKYANFIQNKHKSKQKTYTALGLTAALGIASFWAFQANMLPQTAQEALHRDSSSVQVYAPPIADKTKSREQKLPLRTAPSNTSVRSTPKQDHTLQKVSPSSENTDEQKSPVPENTIPTPKASTQPTTLVPTEVKVPSPPIQPLDCSNTQITFMAHAEPACIGKNNGSIHIDGAASGGKAPYAYYLEHNGVTYPLEALPAGDYWLIVKDHAGCTGRQKITINARNCTEVKDYSFDPTVDKLSIGPMVDAGALNIHSKGGTLVYKHDFSDGALLEWDGRDPSGNIVSNGVYLYTVFKGPEVVQKGYIHIVSSH